MGSAPAETTITSSSAPVVPKPAKTCEFTRAVGELLGPVVGAPPRSACSPEPPEVRDYPPPRPGSPRYQLCNGHLRDLYEALERSREAVPTGSSPSAGSGLPQVPGGPAARDGH